MRYLETRDIPRPAQLEHYPWLQPHSGHDPLVAVAEQQDGLVQGPRHKGCVNWAPIQRQGWGDGKDVRLVGMMLPSAMRGTESSGIVMNQSGASM